jgi:biopolymer transport protein ExbB/TolQ
MSFGSSLRVLFENAGVFGAPLLFLAFATFALAAWAGLRTRELRARPAEARRIVRDVTRVLRLLVAAVSAAPLVGLLGTVHGLIVLFAGFEGAGNFDRDLMTRGVGQALFTTEFGLAIAVPGLVLQAAIKRSLRTHSAAVIHVPARRGRS